MIELELPFPPSVNHYKKVGRIVKTKSGKIYQQRVNTMATMSFFYEVYVEAKRGMPIEWLKFANSETISFDLSVYLYPPDNRRRDVDNGLKVLLDALVHAKVIYDDSLIRKLYVEKMPVFEGGKVIIQLKPYD